MKKITRRAFGVWTLGTLTIAGTPALAADATMTKAKQSVTKGLAYLKSAQEPDGSWGRYPATTALALAAFLRNGRNEIKEPAVAKGVKYLLAAVREDGGIYSNADPQMALPNYNTALCLMTLALTRNAAYVPIIHKAQAFLIKAQFDEDDGLRPSDPKYGGMGYGDDPGDEDRPDLSNLQMALEALKESGAETSSPVWKKAVIFIQRVQNRKVSNDQAWVKDGPNDGGFAYDTKGTTFSGSGGHASYGSMSYAGLKSYIYAGVDRNDPRAKAAWDWIRANYTLTEHPGMGDASLYYYYHTVAKTFDVYGQKVFKDTKGKSHDWPHELATQLTSTQHPDGSWFNTNGRFWEDRPALVTSYTLIALSYCLKR